MTMQHPTYKTYFQNIVETIGNTPLIRLNRIDGIDTLDATILVKMESFNPLASVKDRTALGLIEQAEQDGTLVAGGTLVEATSGNTGIGLAFIAAVKGYHLVLTMPEDMSIERRKLLAFLGAEIILTPARDGMAGALDKAREIVKARPKAMMPSQFFNPANAAIHIRTTAKEIAEATNGKVDIFVAGVGTGGTLQGVATGLRAIIPTIRIVAIQPAESPVLSGGAAGNHAIQGIGANFIPPLLDLHGVDEIIDVSGEQAYKTARALARCEGILGGPSSGAAVAAALRLAKKEENKGKTIVTLLPDSAERYLSTALFADL